jgi:hypothetical protein
LALRRINKRALSHGGALPHSEAQMEEVFETADQKALEQIRQFVNDHDIVELPDAYYYMIQALWPELLHKVKPPRELMH